MKHARLIVLALALLVAAIAAACGGSSSSSSSSASDTGASAAATKVRLVYFWPSIDFLSVPIVVAQQKGYFKDANLDVSLSLPPDSATATKVLGTGDADLGMVTTTDIAAAAQQGVPVAVAGVVVKFHAAIWLSNPSTMGFAQQAARPQNKNTNQYQVSHGIFKTIRQVDPRELLDDAQQQAAQNGPWHAAETAKNERCQSFQHNDPQANVYQGNGSQQQAANGGNTA